MVFAELDAWGVDVAILGPAARGTELRLLMIELFGREPEQVGGIARWTAPTSR